MTSRRYKKPSLAWTLAWAYRKGYLKAKFLKLIHDISICVGLIVVHILIQFSLWSVQGIERRLHSNRICYHQSVVSDFFSSALLLRCYLTGLRMTTVVVTALYKKSLVLSSTEIQNYSTSQIENLMTIDSQAIQDLTIYNYVVWY